MLRPQSVSFTRRELALLLAGSGVAAAAEQARPNILWITCEDTGPHLGCYGDRYSVTPHLDRLAQRSLRYNHAWSNAPVCAPARTTIISGLYPTATGSEHMRSLTRLPEGLKMFPCYLREAGYYCTNNAKEDYNLQHTGKVWDESSAKAHWQQRQPGQPFFAVFNLLVTHESQIRKRPHTLVHDPAGVRVPAYHPDTSEVRHDWAQYYDNITTMDGQAGQLLSQLEADGLAEDTIVFFYGDHGSGMPRSKRWPYQSGLEVPLIVHIPQKFQHLAPKDYKPGGATDQLVGFVDLAPTILSLAGVKPPSHLQGRAFLGVHQAPPPAHLHGFRGRMDERYDLVRSVTDGRYVYVRNYMPHRIYGQHIAYMFETPTTEVWHRLFLQGKLNEVQSRFWRTKPAEELYDLQSDEDEVRNLIDSPDHGATLRRLRQAQQEQALRVRDIGFLPEAEIHIRAESGAPFDVARDDHRYPLARVLAAAGSASSRSRPGDLALTLQHTDSAVRYWSATGLLIQGQKAVQATRAALERSLHDRASAVRIAAAEALGRYGGAAGREQALPVLLELSRLDRNGIHIALLALNSVDALGDAARPLADSLRALPKDESAFPERFRGYYPRLMEDLLSALT